MYKFETSVPFKVLPLRLDAVIQLYMFETSVPFKVLPLELDAAFPALLPMLETLSKMFNGNAVEVRQQFLLNLCSVSKLPALQILLHLCEQKKKKSARSVVRQIGWHTTAILFLATREAFC